MSYTDVQRWTQLLDAWEAQVSRAKASLETAGQETVEFQWAPPTDLGPLPPQLASRAAALVRELQDLSSRSASAIDQLRRQRRAADHLSATSGSEAAPVYLSVDG